MNNLSFAGVVLSKWVPGFDSEIAGKWAAHDIPGLAGVLQEDLGDGRLGTRVPLHFAGPTAQRDYAKVLEQLQRAGRRGVFQHPLRGARTSVLARIRESMKYTTQGTAILAELEIQDAALAESFAFQGGPQAQAGEVRAQAAAVAQKMSALRTRVNQVYRLNTRVRQEAAKAQGLVDAYVAELRDYTNVALAVGNTAIYLANAVVNTGLALALQGVGLVRGAGNLASGAVTTYQDAQARLRALPAAYQAAADAVRAIGVSAPDVQPPITSMELGLAAAGRLDQALREAQPLPIESVVTRVPGQSLYGFVAEKYEGSALTPQQQRAMARAILQLNRIRSPHFIAVGTRLLRPAAA